MKVRFLPCWVIAALVAGCGQPGARSAEGTIAAPKKSASAQPDKPAAPSPSGTTAAPAASASTPKPQAIGPIPADLENDAYHWYGLANSQPMTMEFDMGTGEKLSGVQTITLKSIKKGKAIYDIDRTGPLGEKFGNETVVLQKDGIFLLRSTAFKGEFHNVEMPSRLPLGTTWTNAGKFEAQTGQKVDLEERFSVVKQEDVETKVRTQNALLITSKGNMTLNGAKSKTETKFWYVKDKGLVKATISQFDPKDKKAKPRVITLQETK